MNTLRHPLFYLVTLLVSVFSGLQAAPFAPGNIVVYRVGDGSAALTSVGAAVFLDEYTPTGTLVQSVSLPTTVNGSQLRLVASGTSTAEGNLSRSADGQFLVATGYDAAPGTASVTGSSTTATKRVIARIDSGAAIDTTTGLTGFSAGNIRGAASTDGTAFWATGSNTGIVYSTLGVDGTTVSTSVTNTRAAGIFGGQLYISSGSGTNTFRGVNTVGAGLPTTTGATTVRLPGLTDATSPSTYGFFLADLDAGVAGVDTLYTADDAAGALTKFSLVAGSWVSNGIVSTDLDYRGLTATVSGTTVTLYATRDNGAAADQIISLVDASGYNAPFAGSPTVLASAVTNTAFRGVAFAPVETPKLILTEINSNAAGGDFWELTNVGLTTQNIGSWKWIDSAQSLPAPAAQMFPANTMIAPGESIVIISSSTSTAFLTEWGPLTGVQKIVGGPGLGMDDSVRLYDSNDNLFFTFSYGAGGFTLTSGSGAAGGHAGASAGGAAAQSAVIDPAFGTGSGRRYRAATAGVDGASANASGGLNIGSPGATGLTFGPAPSIMLTLSATSSSFSESAANPVSIGTVTRATSGTSDLVVNLSSSDTTEATVPATVTIPANQTFVTFNITAVDDTFPDGNKTATITASASGAMPGTLDLTVQDDADTLDTSFLLTEIQSNQSAGKPATANDYWELTNVGSTSKDITGYSWHDSGRSASSAQAYKLPGGTTIAAGESIIFTAMPAADFRAWWNLAPSVQVFQSIGAPGLGQGDGISFFDAEQNELFFFDYAAPAVGPPVRLGFLREDGSPSTGGHAGPSGGGSAESQSLIWVSSSGTVSPRYTAATGSNLGTFSAVAPATDLGSPGLGNVRTVSLSNNSVLEGNTGTTVLPLTVTRSDTATAFTVDYAVTGGTATSGTDYAVLASGTLTFTNGGAATQTINLSVNGDTVAEPDETIVVTLSNVINTLGNTLVGTATGTGTILNDDVIAPSLTLEVGGSTIATGGVTSLRVAVSGNPAPTIQWYQGIKGDTSTPVGSPNSPTLLTTSLSGSTNFWVRANNTGGDFDSDTIAVNVVAPVTSVDLSNYVRVGRHRLPEPLLTALPAGTPAHNLLCQEASGVTYNWDTDTLFVVADGGRSVTQVSKTGRLIDTMTLALGASPQGTTFYDIEGVTYIGGGEFVMAEERDRQLVKFTYAAGTTLTRAQTQTVKIGTFVDNTGTEGLSYDPFSGGYVLLKEISPIGIFQSTVNFAAGTASNGSAATVNSTDLFDPALLGMTDVADVFALSVLPSMAGQPQEANLIVLSQEDGKLVNIDRSGTISSTRQLFSDPGNPLSVAGQQHEGVTMDPAGFLYIVNENGGGGIDFPELWVYAPSTAPNAVPTGLSLNGAVTSVIENTSTVSPLRLGEVVVIDDGLGSNVLSLAGPDAAFFELVGNTLFLKTGTILDFETKSSYQVTLQVDDASLGATPDATAPFTLTVTDQDPETPPPPALLITEVAPWSSGNSPVGADWFEVTNNSTSAIDITGWKMDDSSKAFGSAVALNGITSIAPGESVIFIETNDLPGKSAFFLSHWFGTNPPAGLQIGSYTGSGVGLGTSGDAVWLFDSAGQLRSGVTFGASPSGPFTTFDNTAGLNGVAVSRFSAVGVDGALPAFASMDEIGSPGFAAPGLLRITEVAPWSSGNSLFGADWFEVTNVGARVVSLEGWKMDDSSESPLGGAVPLSGISAVGPGESVVFLETETVATTVDGFLSAWFGTNPPAGLQVGTYSGSGVGLSTGGDAVNLFDPANVRQAKVTFGAAPSASPFGTFDNSAALDNVAITLRSVAGVNAAFTAVNSQPNTTEIGSPGVINRPPAPALTILSQTASANGAFSYTLPVGAFVDPENGALSYTATLANGGSLPTWLVFNPVTRTLSGTPSAVDLGRVVVRVTASDNGVPPKTGSIDITVNVGPATGSPYFPLSVASGDPRETGVVLWTRLMDGDTAVNRSVTLHLSTTGSLAEVGTTGTLGGANLWTGGTLTAQSAHDGVVKVKATGLDPDTTYYYQFTYNGERSPIGRTKTAPAATSTRTVKYAAINCNDFVGRYFNVLKHLADHEAENIDFVLNLGDYIYEATGDPSFQTSAPGRAMILSNPAEAINLGGGNYAAQSVGNYRDIYKTIRQDRQLQRVHELFPMISIWDDHEFSDDNWKDNATYFDDRVNEQQTSRKLNAERVWMEFLPTERGLAGSNNGLEIDASDLFPNMTIYDAFNFGENLDLILTDIRSERADHIIPEDAFPATVPMDETAVIATLAAANSLDVPTFTTAVWPGIRTNFAPYVNIDDAPYAAVKAGLLAIVGAGADASLATLPAGQVAATTGAAYATAKVTGLLDASFINSTFAAAGQPAPFDTAALDAMPRGLSFFMLGKTSFFSDFGSRYQVVDQTFQIYAGYMYQLFVGSGGALGRDQALFSSTQETFLATELSTSSAAGRTWRVVASSTPYTPIKFELGDLPDGLALPTQGTISGVTIPASIPSQFLVEFLLNADEPAGFPQYRKGIIDLLAQHDAIFVSGDIHAQLIGNNVATNGQKVVDFTVPSAASSQFRRAVSGAFASVEALMTPSVRAATGLTGNFTFDAAQKQAVIDATDEIIKRNTAEMVDADTSTHGYTVFTASPLAFDASFRKIDVANIDSNLYSQSVASLDALFEREAFRVSKTGSGPATDLALELPTAVTTSVAGNVGGSVSGGGSYLVGSDATFTATPNPGFVFAGWKVNGVPAGTANPLVQTVAAGLVVEASFSYTLQLLHFADAEAGLLAPQTAPNLAALVDAFDGTYANTIILAGGDNYIPGPFAAAGTDGIVAATHTRGNNPFAADIEIHNRIGVQASTVGNHEFDFGTDALSDAINDTTFPYLSANLDFSGDSGISARYQETVGTGGLEEASTLAKKIVPSAVITVNGEKIGLVGATTQIIEGISSTGNVEVKGFPGDGAESNNMALLASQLQPVIDDLTGQGVNKIVLMAHLQQIALEQSLAPLLSGVDIVLAAGSNTRLGDADDVAVAFTGHAADFAGDYPIVTAGVDSKPVLIVNTDNEFTYLGRLIVDFDSNGELITSGLPGRVAENGAYAATAANVAAVWGVAEGDLATTAFAAGTKGAGVKQITDAVQSVISAKDGDVKGFTNFYLEGERAFVRNQETNLGNISADANAFALAAIPGQTLPIVSLKNGGGIRAAIGAVDVVSGAKNPPLANPGAGKAAGGVSLLDIENSMRFNNRLMAFDTTPAGLKAILEHGVASLGGQGRFPQIGGVAFSYDPALAAGSRVRSVALIDEDGATTHSVIEAGSISASAPSAIRLVTLNFLANGGDGYPMKANGENFRYLLTDGTLSAPLDESLSFTAAGNVPANALGEQAAMSLYLTENFGTPDLAYNEPDTAPADDLRIQNLAVRADAVSDVTVTPSFTGSGSVSGGGVRALGTTAQFTATANAGSTFTGWIVNGAPAGTTNPLQVTVTVGMTVEATFLPNYTLQLLHFADAEAGLLAPQTAPYLAALVDAFDGTYANTIILAGGDNYIPGPFAAAGTDAIVAATHNKGNNPFAADIEIHNRIGVQASTVGNHEFDFGTNAFSDAINDANFPYLSANLDFSGDSGISARYQETVGVGGLEEASALTKKIVPSAVITVNGEKIGLVGATTQIIETISSTGNVEVKGFTGDGAEANNMALLAGQLQPVINDLTSQGVNKIVLMAHLQQITLEQSLAPLLTGVDIVLAGGSNTRLGDADDVAVAFTGHAADFAGTYPIVTAGADSKPVLIVNTDNEFTYLGRLIVDFDPNGELITSALPGRVSLNGAYAATSANVAAAWGVSEGDLATTAFAAGTKGAGVKQITDAVQSVIAAKDGDVKGFTNFYLEGERNFVRNQETNLGNISADANAAALAALPDQTVPIVSLKNGGGIRAAIGAVEVGSGAKNPPLANPGAGKAAGGVSLLDIENSMRFNNRLMAFDTTPAGLKAILEHGVAALGGQGRFPQIGGVSFAFDPTLPAGSRVTTISLIGGEGQLQYALYDGEFSPWAPPVIRLVTLNFLANGGDSYPMKANGANFRFLLDDGTLGPILDPTTDFSVVPGNALGEQQALADFLEVRYATPANAYDVADTTPNLDLRIQNLSLRSDAVPFDIDLTINGSGVGSIGNEAIASGERQGIRFSLTEAGRVEITGTGSTALRAELLDESGNIVGTFAGPGSILLAGNFPEGDYLLRVINESSSEEILSLNLETGEVSVPRPDAAVGNSPGTLIGVDAYGPAASQELSLLSRKLGPVKAVVALANRSETDDSIRVEGSGGNRDFKVSYTLRGRNVTAQILAGRLTTAALSSDDAPVLIQSVITPDKQRLTRPGRTRPGVGVRGSAGLGNAKDRDKDRILRRTFISRVTATSSANPAVSDAVQIRVTTR